MRSHTHTHTHRQKRWVIGSGSLPEPISERYNGAKVYKPKRYHSYVLYCVTVFAFVNNSMTLYDVSLLEVYRAKPMPTYYSEAYSHRRYFRLTGSSLYIFPFVNVLVTYCVLTTCLF